MLHKTKNIGELKDIILKLKAEGKKIVHTNGCYDIIHAGHISTLKISKSYGDILVVSINSDNSVKKLKGEGRPIFNENERALVLSAIEYVDYVTIFDEDTIINTLKAIKPDIHVKGGTYIPERVEEEKKLLENWNGELKFAPMVQDKSTTATIQKIQRPQ